MRSAFQDADFSRAAPALTVDEVTRVLSDGFAEWGRSGLTIEEVNFRHCRLRLVPRETALRPGGTVSGPTMFTLADTAFYVAVMASIGPETLAVTTNVSINFLRRPKPAVLIADCTLLKLGKRLAVGEVTIFSDGEDEPVAHASGTYSIPPPPA